MKTRTVFLVIATLILMAFIPNIVNAQDPFKDLTKNDVAATLKVPDIIDFVSAYLEEPDNELYGAIAPEWDKYMKSEKLSKGASFVVDKVNGYIRYDMDYDVAYPKDKTGDKIAVEFCYWNCTDGNHKLFGVNVTSTQNDKPIYSEFSGLYIYAYDNATQKLYMIDQDLLGLGEVDQGTTTFLLPQKGKDIDVFFHNGSKTTQKTLVWNGKGFNLKSSKVVSVKAKD